MKHLYSLTFLLLVAPHASGMQVYLNAVQDDACGTSTGAIDIGVTGGLPPYTFEWSNGAATEDISGLAQGNYSVIVTDANNDQATGQWTISSTQLWCPGSAQDGHASCTGSSGGQVQVIEWGINGTPPYSYSPPPDGFDPQGDPYFVFQSTPPGTMVTIGVTDANGCSGTLYEWIAAPQTVGGPNMQVTGIQGSCSTGTGGAATITNVNDGSFFTGPDWELRDAFDNYVAGSNNATNVMPFTGLAPGDYHFVRYWDLQGMYMAWGCSLNPYDRIDFTIPDLGTDCGSVSGTVFIDNDQDCAQDAGEVGVPYAVLQVLPGTQYTITNEIGQYHTDMGNGSYTLGQTAPILVQLCPVAAPVPFTINFDPVTLNIADSSTVALDLSAQLQSTAMRPGFAGTYWGRVKNLSPQVSGAVTITLAIDPALAYGTAAPAPTNVAGNTLMWQFASFAALQALDFHVSVQVPVGTALGTPLNTTFTVQNALNDAEPGNNSATVSQAVVGSYDPNDKTAHTSSGSSESLFFIGEDEWIDYVIRFQNTGTDTAFTVVVTDTLSEVLDVVSFQQGVASHPFSVEFKPDRVVEWRFTDILLPDSNANEAGSHGLVTFRIRPHQPLLPGTVITNNADIFFDFNDPVRTNDAVVTAEFSTGVRVEDDPLHGVAVFPNPGSDQVHIIAPSAFIVSVMDVAGREVMRGSVRDGRSTLGVAHLPAGVYQFRVITTDGSVVVRRWTKQ